MAASYPTTIKSFETKSTGNVIYTTHITDLEAEVVAIETALKTGPTVLAAASFSGAVTLTGGLNTPLVVAQGGTGLATLTSAGVLIGAGTGTPTTVAPSTSGNVLTSDGSVWASSAAVSSALDPTTQVFTSGSGTYTTPANCKTIRVRLVGGGGGSGASATNSGTAGGNSTFSASSMQANGGGEGGNGAGRGGYGGEGGSGANGLINANGNSGGAGGDDLAAAGGVGGGSYFGGGGRSGPCANAQAAQPGAAYGAGGGGPGATPLAANSAGGGGAGGYCERLIDNPSATYTYAVGAAGTGGAAGDTAGQAGSAGVVVVEEWYV